MTFLLNLGVFHRYCSLVSLTHPSRRSYSGIRAARAIAVRATTRLYLVLPDDKYIAYSLLICWLNRYNQEPFIGLTGERQMNDVGAVPTAAGETLEIFWMRSYHHNVGSHVKLPAGRARNPLTHIHVGDAKPVDVLRSSGSTRYKRVVALTAMARAARMPE